MLNWRSDTAHKDAIAKINAALQEGDTLADYDRGNRRREAVMATKRKCSI